MRDTVLEQHWAADLVVRWSKLLADESERGKGLCSVFAWEAAKESQSADRKGLPWSGMHSDWQRAGQSAAGKDSATE